MVASITWGIRLFTLSLVPLHSLGASRFRRSIIGEPTLSNKLCGGIPEGSRELRNSMGYWTDSSTSTTESIDLYEVVLPGSCAWICRLMTLTLLFLGARIARSQSHLWSLKWFWMFGKTLFFRASNESTMLQKLSGKLMSSVFGSTGAFPFPRVSSCPAKRPAFASPCKWTRMLVVSLKLVTYLQSPDDFKHALSSSAIVPFGITGSVWRKSPASSTKTPPMRFPLPRRSWSVRSKASNACLCAMVHSSQTISSHSCKTLASPVPLLMLQSGASQCVKFRGSFSVECAVRPPWSSVAAIPEEATAIAILDRCRIFARSKLMTNVLPVPPGASRNSNPPAFLSIRSNIALWAALWSTTSIGLFASTY